MPIKSNHLDTHHLYAHFLDALETGMSADDIASIITDALNSAKTSYEATLRQAQQKEKEAAIDELLSAASKCGSVFDISELISDPDDCATLKANLMSLMEQMHDIFNLGLEEKEEEEG